jgi:hypothetical protein
MNSFGRLGSSIDEAFQPLGAMLIKVVSGGQSGADQAGLRAARSAGIATGGWALKGWLVETPDGRRSQPAPRLADFGLVECPEPGYPARTKANVRDSDGTLWFGAFDTPGFTATHDAALVMGKPFLIVYANSSRPSEAREWVEAKGIRVLNIAGDRESKQQGIGTRVERYLGAVFRQLEHIAGPSSC